MNLPTALTLARIAAIPPMCAFAMAGHAWCDIVACAIFAIAGLTDFFDGELARRLKQTSPLGAILDPVADKMLIAASITILAANANIRSTTLCPAMIIILRETMIGGLREHLAGRGPRIASSHTAKWKTATQMAAIGLLMASTSGAYYVGIGWLPIERLGRNMLWIAAALSLASAWPYVKAATAQTSQDQRLKAL